MPSDIGLTSRPGRPPQFSDDERRHILFQAAENVFLEKGYNAATMNDIAHQAGMSKKTLYQVFSAKAALFDALLHERWGILAVAVEDNGDDPEEALVEILIRMCGFIMSPRQIAMTRVMIAEAHRTPEISLAVERQCLSRGDSAVEQWLVMQASRGKINVADPRKAAGMLVGAVFSKTLFDLIFGIVPQPTPKEIEQQVRSVVQIFVTGLSSAAT